MWLPSIRVVLFLSISPKYGNHLVPTVFFLWFIKDQLAPVAFEATLRNMGELKKMQQLCAYLTVL